MAKHETVTDATFSIYFLSQMARDREIVHVIEYACDLYGHFRFLARDHEIVVLYIDTITGQVMIG